MAVGDGRMDALVLKLRHPLPKIRSRALRSLLFKLRERLVCWHELEPLQTALVPSLLTCLEPPLELDALHVLQLLMAQSQSDVLLSSLHHCGAAQTLQRAAHATPELRATYEQLLRQIYASPVVSKDDKKAVCSRSDEENEHIAASLRASKTKNALSEVRSALKVDKLEARGWRFAQVTLLSVDEQYLFEFEVKLQLKTKVQDIVVACATLRNKLLRDFPAELFLQRPTVLQYLLQLVQQPVLPCGLESTSEQDKDRNVAMEKAMYVSMGVNYFDDMSSATFANTQGNVAGAVVMASLKAIESLLYALQLTRRVCLDPTYIVHAPAVHVPLFDSYDIRRVLYPRARVELDENAVKQRFDDCASQLPKYSLSGAVYRIFMSVLPLMRSARYPRQHLLNLLIVALPSLPEKSRDAQELDKSRLECIFAILCSVCRPSRPEQALDDMVDDDLELTHSMTWKLVELVLRLLRLFPPSMYRVEAACGRSNGSTMADKSSSIIVPRQLWETVKSWTANPALRDVSAREWKDESLVQNLSKIGSTIATFVDQRQSSAQDAKSILAFVAFAKHDREQLADVGSRAKPVAAALTIAKKVVQAKCVFDDSGTEAIAYAVLQTIWSALAEDAADKTSTITESNMECIHFIFCDMISALGVMETPAVDTSMSVHFFRGFLDLLDKLDTDTCRVSADCWHQFVTHVIAEPGFLVLLLLVLARRDVSPSDKHSAAVLWGMLRITLTQLANVSSEELGLLEPVMPLIQHFAYTELSGESCRELRLTQPELVQVLNRVETAVSDHSRMLSVCRCLLHQSSYVRRAASSRVIRLLSLATSADTNNVSNDKAIRDDPFGGGVTRDGKTVNFDVILMETPLPVVRASECRPHGSELSSQLSKLAHLCTVVSGSSVANDETMREAALNELVMFIEQSSVELFTLLEELDKLSDLLDLLRSLLQADDDRNDSSMVHRALVLFRTMLLRSRSLRAAIRLDGDMVELIMPLIFHPSVSVRVQMYYVLLLLTCSAENFVPAKVSIESSSDLELGLIGEARIPEMIKTTFGLYSSRWARCLVVTCSLKQQLQVSCAQLTKQTEASWLQEVKALISQASCRGDGLDVKHDTSGECVFALFDAEYTFVARRFRDASSHGKCLNALYHLMTICEAWSFARERFVREWELEFERYFAVPPKSERDEMIIGSVVAAMSAMFFAMTRGEQLRALVVIKRKVLPLLERSQSKIFSLQVARLLLNVSESKVGDLFLSLAADTDIIATICTKYSAIYSTEPVLHGLMLDVLSRFAKGLSENADTRLSSPSRDKICKRLLEMLSPLLTVVCRHRVPGSFLERDIFVVGSQCIASILLLLPRTSLLTSDCHLEHIDSNALVDGSWASRYLFDHSSPIRELGFLVLEHTSSFDFSATRLLERAFETSTDDTEADAVRAAACTALTKAIARSLELPPGQEVVMPEALNGTAFSRTALRSLSHMLEGSKFCPRASSAFARLVRLLYVQQSSLALILGDMQKELQAAKEECHLYTLLVQALSLRDWKDKCNRYCSCCMLLPSCDVDAWKRSLLPAILDLMFEVLNLLQAVCRDADNDLVAFLFMHTNVQNQLIELVQDIYASLDDSSSASMRQSHYEILSLCAGTLGILSAQVLDQPSDCAVEQCRAPVAPGVGAGFADVVAKLLDPRHPVGFRASFSRVVPCISWLVPELLRNSDATTIAALGFVVLDLYQEVAGLRPMDAKVVGAAMPEPQSHIFSLSSTKRISYAFQVLIDASPKLRELGCVKHALLFAMSSMKESFSAIRSAGGFDGKRAGSSGNRASTHDAYVLDLCGRIQTHIEVMSAIVGGDNESQQIAKVEGLPSVVLSNWTTMKMAHARGSQLMLHALYLLANYAYGNDTARRTMLISLQTGSTKVSGSGGTQTLVSLLFGLATSRGETAHCRHQIASGANTTSPADMAVSNAACLVLKTVLLNMECVLASRKTGAISKLIDSLRGRLKQDRQTSKTNPLETRNLANMLGVLSSVAANEEGAGMLYSNWATMLSSLLDDAMHSFDEAVQRNGCLFLRNLALSQASKNHFAVWEELLDDMIAICARANLPDQVDSTVAEYLSTALWALVYDSQKARAVLLSRPIAVRSLQQVLDPQSAALALRQSPAQGITENLRRVLKLVKEQSTTPHQHL
ncbi:unnamed protein product [Hyaloperonospora brassicae]|uniref:Rotatin N-terminal domain-containing protein n=1 Tax=Hyaloperonospora brassicae TaxID=162125 RepID=A0AAV0UEG9_HYABA|nr:unnamed protein product [Hyaloperonospora brassicae]